MLKSYLSYLQTGAYTVVLTRPNHNVL